MWLCSRCADAFNSHAVEIEHHRLHTHLPFAMQCSRLRSSRRTAGLWAVELTSAESQVGAAACQACSLPTQDTHSLSLMTLVHRVQKDIHELRRLASVRGLVTPYLRKIVWPLLLGVPASHSGALPSLLPDTDESGRTARDAQTIANDVARCLHESQVDVGTQDRDALRIALIRLLKAVVDGTTVYYYQVRLTRAVRARLAQVARSPVCAEVQIHNVRSAWWQYLLEQARRAFEHLEALQGLHEIATTIMLQVGEAQAYVLLQRLVCTQLRDSTRATLDPVTESLQLVQPIIESSDARLGAHLRRAQIPPYFAISWVITWFAHNVDSALVPRLFDLFLASHPLMPVYLYLAGVLEVRAIRACELACLMRMSGCKALCKYAIARFGSSRAGCAQ